mgnify:CR=1 FL=1
MKTRKRKAKKGFHGGQKILILENIRSVHNVGAIFRTADAIGISEIILTGYTPTPKDRFGRIRKDFIKASLGAEKNVLWRTFPTTKEEIEILKKENFTIISLEQVPRAIHYKKYIPKGNCALIVGNEVSGVSKEVLTLSDTVIFIPMRGKKESLNVSVATGIALFQLFDRR